MKKYFIRLDDACSTMCSSKWKHIEEILTKHMIRPMVGVIPYCEDKTLMIDSEDPSFWGKVRIWQDKGWAVALHGYNHVYSSRTAGINPFWERSEFAGVPLCEQKMKIREGVRILNRNDIYPQYFFAPSHTYDENTLIALREESDIRIICDTISLEAYVERDFVFVPCQFGHFRNIPFDGIWTFCFHPNVMTDNEIKEFDLFIQNNRQCFYSWNDLELSGLSRKSIKSKLISWLYFTYRKFRGLK